MSYSHLTRDERAMIAALLSQSHSLRSIARILGRHHSTIVREVRRFGMNRSCYEYQHAQWHAESCRMKARHHYRSDYLPLIDQVVCWLEEDWSPEQISMRLYQDYPRDQRMRLSIESLYQWIYRWAEQGRQFYRHLRRQRQQRVRHTDRRYHPFYGLDKRHISERPKSAKVRSRYGHWEGDLVLGERGTGGILTCVDRKSRYLIACLVKDKTEPEATGGIVDLMSVLPERLQRTMTLDQGSEFRGFREVEARSQLDVFFCDPSSPWQRGTNENTNGLLRQYFPKGMDMSRITQQALDRAVAKLNNRPRKCLGYRTPAEVLSNNWNGALGI